MQSVSSRIWTSVAVSISYNDNHYTTGTSNIFIRNRTYPLIFIDRVDNKSCSHYPVQGDRAIWFCPNYWEIYLLSITGKILTRIQLNKQIVTTFQRAIVASEPTGWPQAWCLFSGRSQWQEQSKRFYVAFVDLRKAFDIVNRKEIWQIMGWLDCSPKFLNCTNNSMAKSGTTETSKNT